PIGSQELLEVVHLEGTALEGHGDGGVAHVEDLRLEDLHQLEDAGPHLALGLHGDEQQLALDGVARVELADRHDVDELEELLDDLVERRRLHVDDDRDTAQRRIVGGCHRERLDVVAPAGEQPGHSGEHAGPVLDEDRERVVTGLGHRTSPCWDGGTTTWEFVAPAGTIGKTFSLASVRKSMTTGRSLIEFAFSMAAGTSSGDSTRMPTQPIASAHIL